MNVQDLFAALHIRSIDNDLTIEAAWAEQSGVKNVSTVGCRDKNNGVVGLETVHFNEQLVQSLLTFVVATAQTSATLAADGVNFVDEDDRGRSFLCLLEQVTNTGSTHAYEHFHEVGARDAKERNARFACNGTRKQGFTSTRRAHQKATARNLCTERLILCRVFQEVLDFLHFLNRFINAGNIGEVNVGMLLNALLRLCLAE